MTATPLSTRSGRKASQHPGELNSLIGLFLDRGVTSYLEIGARHGDTFFEVMRSLPEGSRGVAVDLPEGPWGASGSRESLQEAVSELQNLGMGTLGVLGDSRSEAVLQRVRELGPYDAVLIDGDHRYEAVSSDFRHYQAPITAFHDIAGHGLTLGDKEMGVPRFWNEIKDEYEHLEIIDPSDERPMGIGVLFCE